MTFADTGRRILQEPRALWTIASNAIPVVGVLFFGWQALPLMVFYWLENVVIGAINVLKILVVSVGTAQSAVLGWAIGLFMAAFFVVHYGMFCFVHGIFVFGVFAFTDLVHNGQEPSGDAFDLGTRVGAFLHGEFLLGAVMLVLIRLGEFVVLWLGSGAWRTSSPQMQLHEPYGRIIVLHVTLLIGTVPVIALGQPFFAVLVLALLKTGLELGMPMFGLHPQAQAATR